MAQKTLSVASGSKITECVEAAMEHLKTASSGGSVLVTAKDKAINKAISIAEITKRQFGETKAPETLPPASTAFSDATTTKKARADTDTDTIEGILAVEGGSVLGSFDAEKTKAPLVIPLKLVNEWRGVVAKEPTAQQQQQHPSSTTDTDTDREPGSRPSPAPSTESTASLASILSARAGTKWGLQLRAPSSSLAASPLTNNSENDAANKDNEPDTRTLEQKAIDALLNASTSASSSTTVLPILAKNAVPGIRDIADPKEKYLYDLSLRPEEATLEDFEQVPIEDFGIAMLRGMGYKDEVEDEKKKNKKDFVFISSGFQGGFKRF
ncbi:hypothetical protein HDU79_006156 [Rhizoclosmatium sp. JEL0117]|nr:hypothetical protein HDU79_006156 [Rhizoclosmatium sp. JEL0117]